MLSRLFLFVAMNFTSLKPRFNDVDRSSVKVELAIFTDGVDHMRSSTYNEYFIMLRTVTMGVSSSVLLNAHADEL